MRRRETPADQMKRRLADVGADADEISWLTCRRLHGVM
jgi:hypothetical protein